MNLEYFMEEAHIERRRAGDLDPDHLLRLPFLLNLLHDLTREPGPAHLGLGLDPDSGVPQPPELRSGERQLCHARRRARGPRRRGLGRRHGALPREASVPERALLLVGVEPTARVGEHAVVGAEHVLDRPPWRVVRVRRGGAGVLGGGVAGAAEAAEDEGHGGATGGAAGADGVGVVGVGRRGGAPGGGRARRAAARGGGCAGAGATRRRATGTGRRWRAGGGGGGEAGGGGGTPGRTPWPPRPWMVVDDGWWGTGFMGLGIFLSVRF